MLFSSPLFSWKDGLLLSFLFTLKARAMEETDKLRGEAEGLVGEGD